ncbi:MAG: hypothetical protein ACLQME_16555 [Alphaproteobacteria bacterium]
MSKIDDSALHPDNANGIKTARPVRRSPRFMVIAPSTAATPCFEGNASAESTALISFGTVGLLT